MSKRDLDAQIRFDHEEGRMFIRVSRRVTLCTMADIAGKRIGSTVSGQFGWRDYSRTQTIQDSKDHVGW